MQYALVEGKRSLPIKGVVGICEGCNQSLIAKCGNIKIHHWAHQGNSNCDKWWEQETLWHRTWKEKFPAEWREIRKQNQENNERHIADIYNPYKDLVIEFQNSPITIEEIKSREDFYQKMLWVLNGEKVNIKLSPVESAIQEIIEIKEGFLGTSINNAIKIPFSKYNQLIKKRDEFILQMKIGSYKRELTLIQNLFNETFDDLVEMFSIKNNHDIKGLNPKSAKEDLIIPIAEKALNGINELVNKNFGETKYYKFNWTRKKTTWAFSTKPIFLDIGDQDLLLLVSETIAKKVSYREFIAKYGSN